MKQVHLNKSSLFGLGVAAVLLVLLVAWPAAAQEGPGGAALPTPTAPGAGPRLYLPLISRSLIVLNGDLLVDSAEVTQAIQNPSNKVPLIAGKTTALRVYAHRTGSSGVSGLWVSVSASHNGTVLAGSPLVVKNAAAPTGWYRSDLTTSTNLTLPAAWLSAGKIDLTVTIDPNNQFLETNEANNSLSLSLTFVTVPPLSVKVIPIEYYNPRNGVVYPAPNASFVAAALLRVYPVSAVNVTVRNPYSYGKGGRDLVDVSAWNELLNQLTDLKQTDNAPDYQVYYGLVPSEDAKGLTWFEGGVAGLSWMSRRVGSGMDNAEVPGWYFSGGSIAAHEIGHTLGMAHIPCGNVSTYDRNYPYKGGSIGQYGLNPLKMQVFVPETYTDIMGYCQTQWVSDYTYNNWYLNQNQFGGPQADTAGRAEGVSASDPQLAPGLMVRAQVQADGSLETRPFYQFTGRVDAPAADGPYRLEYLDEQGGVVAAYPVGELYAQEPGATGPGIEVRAINALVPLPGKPYVSVRLSRTGADPASAQVLAEKLLSPQTLSRSAAPSITTEVDQVVLRWGAPQTPSVVRYSTDAGQSWETVAIDALGGWLSLPRQTLPAGRLLFEVILADTNTAPYRLEWDSQP